jgi:hypothetical protein
MDAEKTIQDYARRARIWQELASRALFISTSISKKSAYPVLQRDTKKYSRLSAQAFIRSNRYARDARVFHNKE